MIQGIGIVFIIMAISYGISSIAGYPLDLITTSLLLGIVIGNILKLNQKKQFQKGIIFSEKKILEGAIILMGLKLNLTYLAELGTHTIIFVCISITATIALAPILGRLFKLDSKASILTGVGNAVCGSSAITAFNPVWGAPIIQMGIVIGVINFLGTIGIFVTPFLAKLLNFSNLQSSFLIGGTLQSVGHVAAAGFAMGQEVGEGAILIKMFRVLMIGPIVLGYSFYKMSKQQGKITIPTFPLFIIGFLSASAVTSFVGEHFLITNLLTLSKILLAHAMAAIGMNISFSAIKNNGASILYTGGTIFIFQITLAIILIYLLGI